MQTQPCLPPAPPSTPAPAHTWGPPRQGSGVGVWLAVPQACCVTLGKTLALSGPLWKMALKASTYRIMGF